MKFPRIVITGDILRPGQDGNICFLWAALAGLVSATFGTRAELVRGRPLAWDEWLLAQRDGAESYGAAWEGADLVIGFELPPAAKEAAPAWIDIRRHPFRFDQTDVAFSFNTSFGGRVFSAQPMRFELPRVKASLGLSEDIAIMLQVASDASLIKAGGVTLYQPADLTEDFAKVCHEQAVWIVPHPQEPHGAWREALLRAIPRAKVWAGTAYEAMTSMKRMVTISSSTGFEAAWFGCAATFLKQPEAPSHPYELRSPALWRELAEEFNRFALRGLVSEKAEAT